MAETAITVRGTREPVVRYVYLVQDLSDAARMGGVTSNVYTTSQAAYDAAVVLQTTLGGTNKVVIQVLNTASSLTLGTVVLTANWNPNISIVGLSSANSFFGAIIGGAFTINVSVFNITINAGCTSTAGITMTAVNSVINTLSTSSTTGDSGNIIINNSSNSTFGSFTLDSTVGNVGNTLLNNCVGCFMGSVFMRATSAIGSFNVGTFSLGNCRTVTFTGQVTLSITNAASTGQIGGIIVGRTNGFIFFNQPVNILGCTTSARSDVQITNISLYNCVFNNTFLVNTTGTFISERGGWVLTTDINNCIFHHRFRMAQWPINPKVLGNDGVTPLTLTIKNTKFVSLSAGALGAAIQNNDTSFEVFNISDATANDFLVGITIQTNPIFPPVVSFMIDGESINLSNIASNIFVSLYDVVPNSATYDVIMSNCSGFSTYLESWENSNFQVNMCNYQDAIYGYGFGLTPRTKPYYINSSRMSQFAGNSTINTGGIGVLNFIIKNSYFGYSTDVLNPWAISMSAVYNSFIESFAQATSTSSFSGTLFTSTIRRLTTESVAGLTFNNSYDDPY